MKNIKLFLTMTAIASMIITSNSKAKLSGAYVGVNYVNAYNDSVANTIFRGTSAVGNISANTVGGGVEVGYNYNIDNILIGGGLSYIYAAPNYAHVADINKSNITSIDQGISGNRINLDINAGYVFEDKVALTLGGIISYNPRKPKYLIPGFDKKTTSDFGFGFKVGTDIKLTESLSFDIAYRMIWFTTTKEYRDYIEKNKTILATAISTALPGTSVKEDDLVKVSKLSRVDKMLTFGIRFNF